MCLSLRSNILRVSQINQEYAEREIHDNEDAEQEDDGTALIHEKRRCNHVVHSIDISKIAA